MSASPPTGQTGPIRDIEAFRKRQLGTLPDTVGFELVAVGDKTLDARMAVQPKLLAPNGFLHAARAGRTIALFRCTQMILYPR